MYSQFVRFVHRRTGSVDSDNARESTNMTGYEGRSFGNYRVLQFLGHGGFAEVYRGEHIYLGTQVAIKILRTRLSPANIASFQAEARAIAGLEHPNIVRVLDFGITGSIPYLVMGYAQHGSL